MMTSVAPCNNFRPNFWRPTTCSNCLRPKSRHARSAAEVEKRRPRSCADAGDGTDHAGRRATLTAEQSPSSSKTELETEERRVGVVYPYAVVQVAAVPGSEEITTAVKMRPHAPTQGPPCHSRDERQSRRRSRSLSSASPKPPATPKRKAPPPPLPKNKDLFSLHAHSSTLTVHHATATAANSSLAVEEPLHLPSPQQPAVKDKATAPETTEGSQEMKAVPSDGGDDTATAAQHSDQSLVSSSKGQVGHNPSRKSCEADKLLAETAVMRSRSRAKKAGPKKPPRTLSTFLEGRERTLRSATEDTVQYSILRDCSEEAGGEWVGVQLSRLMADTVQRVYAKFLEQVMRPDLLWEVGWQHLSLLSPRKVAYQGLQMSLQKLPVKLDSCTESDIRASQCLSPHPNLCLVRALLPPPCFPPLSSSSHHLLRDCQGVGTLAQLLPARRESAGSNQFHELLLLCMVQVLNAVQFIYSRGVCHRDIGLDCLYVTQYGHHWLIKLGRFHYAVHRPGPVTATSFVYGYQELCWLGGADSRLPPEIMNTPENAQTLDYSGTDCFAVGCLFYEMLGLDNPFEVNSQLVYSQYRAADLPHFSSCPSALQQLVRLLLCRDPRCRLAPSAALLLCQALLWLPTHWLESPVSETLLRQHLECDCGSLVAAMATMDVRPVPLSHILHAKFLHSCDVPELVRSLFVFHGNHD